MTGGGAARETRAKAACWRDEQMTAPEDWMLLQIGDRRQRGGDGWAIELGTAPVTDWTAVCAGLGSRQLEEAVGF